MQLVEIARAVGDMREIWDMQRDEPLLVVGDGAIGEHRVRRARFEPVQPWRAKTETAVRPERQA